MALIRKSDVQTAARDAIVLNLGDVVREGQGVVEAAREQSHRIVAQAKLEREAIIAGAREEGYAAGLAQGLEKGRAEGAAQGKQNAHAEWNQRLATLQSAWGSALEGFVRERENLLAAARVDVLRLALNIAERVTRRHIALDSSVVLEQIARVLEMLCRPTRLKVRVHPDDESACRDALPGLIQRYAAAEQVEIVVDATLARGSCVAAGAGGEIDASITTMLDRIAKGILPCDAEPSDPRLTSTTADPMSPPPATNDVPPSTSGEAA